MTRKTAETSMQIWADLCDYVEEYCNEYGFDSVNVEDAISDYFWHEKKAFFELLYGLCDGDLNLVGFDNWLPTIADGVKDELNGRARYDEQRFAKEARWFPSFDEFELMPGEQSYYIYDGDTAVYQIIDNAYYGGWIWVAYLGPNGDWYEDCDPKNRTFATAEDAYTNMVRELGGTQAAKTAKCYSVRYSYPGDDLSDYQSNILVENASDEQEAIDRALDYLNKRGIEAYAPSIDAEFSSSEEFFEKYPGSNYEVVAKVAEDLNDKSVEEIEDMAIRDNMRAENEAIMSYDEYIEALPEGNAVRDGLENIRDEEKAHAGELQALIEETDPEESELFEEGENEVTSPDKEGMLGGIMGKIGNRVRSVLGLNKVARNDIKVDGKWFGNYRWFVELEYDTDEGKALIKVNDTETYYAGTWSVEEFTQRGGDVAINGLDGPAIPGEIFREMRVWVKDMLWDMGAVTLASIKIAGDYLEVNLHGNSCDGFVYLESDTNIFDGSTVEWEAEVEDFNTGEYVTANGISPSWASVAEDIYSDLMGEDVEIDIDMLMRDMEEYSRLATAKQAGQVKRGEFITVDDTMGARVYVDIPDELDVSMGYITPKITWSTGMEANVDEAQNFIDSLQKAIDMVNDWKGKAATKEAKSDEVYTTENGRTFMYDEDRALLQWVDLEYGLGVLSEIGLSKENWEDNPDYWLEAMNNRIDEETGYMMSFM